MITDLTRAEVNISRNLGMAFGESGHPAEIVALMREWMAEYGIGAGNNSPEANIFRRRILAALGDRRYQGRILYWWHFGRQRGMAAPTIP